MGRALELAPLHLVAHDTAKPVCLAVQALADLLKEAKVYLCQFFVEGLGHASYLIASDQTKEAAVVDPGRETQPYLARARQAGVTIRAVIETHVHNDFVSGAKPLAASVGAEHVAPAEADLTYPYHAVRAGDELVLGELCLTVLFTPGHTPEHVCYVVADTSRAAAPVLLFSGGDLLVGSVGRPDLLGKELGKKLAPQLYDSLHEKILKLADYVTVLPTHGAGSLCGKHISGTRTSTIGYERRFNPALQKKTRPSFVRYVLSGNPGIPTYFWRMRPLNQQGLTGWHAPEPRPLSPEAVRRLTERGGIVLDARSNAAFGGGHIPGATNVPLGLSFATWVGWLVSDDAPLALVLADDAQWDDVVTRLARIGYDNVAGYLEYGMPSWFEAALPTAHVPQWSIPELHERLGQPGLQILDVRTDDEWEAGHILGAAHIPLGDLPARAQELDPTRLTVVICSTGYRSSIGTSLLLQRGFTRVANALGGMTAWSVAGYPTTPGAATIDEHSDAEQLRVDDAGQFLLPRQ